MKLQNQNTNRLAKGLNTDSSPIDQPKGTYRYAKNAVLESVQGDVGFLSNELGAEVCALFPEGYIPIGKTYMSNGEVAILLTNVTETLSEIGILTDNCKYTTHVNADLGFRVSKQIDATFRLRRGCERTIYFTDDENKPRIYNFDKPEDFEVSPGVWDVDKFNLFKIYSSIPVMNDFEIRETGNLLPGSYNFSIQYLDEDLNPTEWIKTSDTVIIYNDNTNSKGFKSVRGSTNKQTFYQEFGATNKSISFNLGNLDSDFPYYRIAIIEATEGGGEVTRVLFSAETSTQVTSYTYTGDNAISEGTVEEIQAFNNVIEKARHIEQIENRLILADVQGKQVNYCRLQKYASKVKAQLVTQEVVLNNIASVDNPKRGTLHVEQIGYMPGEIYSFGIVWIFADGTLSPVFHIPGRAETYLSDMSLDNELTNTVYLPNETCNGEDFWGYDSQGQPLSGESVRHHRFPLRSEVNEPLIVKDGSTTELETNYLYVDISGTIDTGVVTASPLLYQVQYTVGGVPTTKDLSLSFDAGSPDIDITNIFVDSSSEEIVYTQVLETPTGGGPLVDPASNSTLTYEGRVESQLSTVEDAIYTTNIFGVEFSDIDVPSIEDTNGEEIVGYYIVRNERKETDKTILDTAVMTPLLIDEESDKFVSHGHLMPNASGRLKTDVFALIHPEHKFRGREYSGVTQIIKEGEFIRPDSANISIEEIQDVMPGTSYDAEVNKKRDRDADGFDLVTVSRNNTVNYSRTEEILADEAEIEEIFYLDTLFTKTVTDTAADRKDIYNLSADNKIGIVQLNIDLDEADFTDRVPFVVLKRELSDPYSNFRVLPYYNETTNATAITGATGNSVTVFNGDSYIGSMRYLSSSFYNIAIASRRTKKGILNFILGVLAIIVGVVISIATAGAGVAAGIAVAGFGVSQLATGFKKNQAAAVYLDLYEQGLKNTVDDDDTTGSFDSAPDDDQIQWFTDILTNLWFESGVNPNWRMGNTIGLTDFLDSPGNYDQGEIDAYTVEKVTSTDAEADGGRNYQGYCKAEIYEINLDYLRRNKEKLHFHLPFEYDCCSDCLEDFPHRTHYSEQSFQEELTDNYRTFLPNNYRDIEGETGIINNVFRIQNNLYIHTDEALWHLPQNIQERVTGDIISFLGAGDFFGIPPRKILDGETGNTAGTQHKWGTVKTPHGVFFVSENQRTIYKFNGNNLEPISNLGQFNWFKNNTPVEMDKEYYDVNTKRYPYRDNPSNEFGTGFILTYDSRHERILLTKKDFVFAPGEITSTDYELCILDGNLIIHEDIDATIAAEEAGGWTYIGMNEDCQICFERQTTETITVQESTTISNTADIHVFYDTSGSFGTMVGSCLTAIDDAIDDWVANFGAANPDWSGSVYKYEDSTERWLNYAQIISSTTYFGQDLSTKDIIVISFCNEAATVYHDTTLDSPIVAPTTQYLTDYSNFLTLHSQYNSFVGLMYPIVFGTSAGACTPSGGGSIPASKNFLLHSIAAWWGVEMTAGDILAELPSANPGFTAGEWTTLTDELQAANPYPDDGLINYGWSGKWDRYADASGNVIDSLQFQEDIEELLAGTITTEDVEVEVPVTEYQCLDGRSLNDPTIYDCSWTKSFAIKFNAWVAWHDYEPNFYINTPDKFYSWRQGDDNVWKHNADNLYQNYYDVKGDFIVEFVSLSNPLTTRIWDHIKLITEASKFDDTAQAFVDQRFVTFNEVMLYNSRQNSGLLSLIAKDTQANPENYMLQQLTDVSGQILADRNERDWTLNDLRDMIGDYTVPMFLKDKLSVQGVGYIDKIVNPSAIDLNKDWSEQEVFRDKYLIIRLIFNTFDDTKLLLNYSVENETLSSR